jgi:hypothetical protein
MCWYKAQPQAFRRFWVHISAFDRQSVDAPVDEERNDVRVAGEVQLRLLKECTCTDNVRMFLCTSSMKRYL